MPEVYNRIVNKPSARFWVSDIRAALVVSAIMRGDARLEKMWPMKREMFQEIYNRFIALRERVSDLSISDLCAIVVEHPAPKFSLTAGRATMMSYKAKKLKRHCLQV